MTRSQEQIKAELEQAQKDLQAAQVRVHGLETELNTVGGKLPAPQFQRLSKAQKSVSHVERFREAHNLLISIEQEAR